jgi:hypothetical protein
LLLSQGSDRCRTGCIGERPDVLLEDVLVVWIVLLPLATVLVLYAVAPLLHRRRDVNYRPRRLRTYGIVLRRILRSSHSDQFAP